MPITNIQYINSGDDESEFIDKVNHNFDEIIEAHGGSQGIVGPTGSIGAFGDSGIDGPTGVSGPRGTRWFAQSVQPSGSGNTVMEGDFWVETSSGDIYEFTESGWTDTGYSISSDSSIFTTVQSSQIAGGTGNSVLLNQVLPENYVFILADVIPSSGVLNEGLSKFVISSDTSINDSPLLEFSRTDLENGTISDYSLHPTFEWLNFSSSDRGMLLQIPGGAFYIGASGGFQSIANALTITSSTSRFEVNYGTTSGSGIYSTGGININSPSGTFEFISPYFNLTGPSGSMNSPVISSMSSSPSSILPYSVYLYSGGGSATGDSLVTSRLGDTFDKLSHNVYHISLENSQGKEFYIDTKGKILTRKIYSPITYGSVYSSATGTVGSNLVNWYTITPPFSSTGIRLTSGNTMVLTPYSIPTSSYIGIGISNIVSNGLGTTGGIENNESIDVSVYFSPNSTQTNYSDGIKYIGKNTSAIASTTNVITLPFNAVSIDFTISRGVTGSSSTSVYYRAYGPTGGSGGSFVL
jgi:hypothetical protein